MSANNPSPTDLIDARIAELTDWRGAMFGRLRSLISAASPELTEEWKWDTGVWTYNGLVCSIGAFKDHVAVNFFKGASLPDPKVLFNGGLEAKASRSVQFRAGDKIPQAALRALVRAAVQHNPPKR